MNSVQYEELCRFFLAHTIGITVEKVTSPRIPNPKHTNLPEYSHQIDLYWETGDEICAYVNIANAKWRDSEKIDQGEVLLLDSVKQKVSAQKAVMIANTGFTSGADAAAKSSGIALHVLEPTFSPELLPSKDRAMIQAKLSELASASTASIFSHRVCHRAFELAVAASASPAPQPPRAAAPVKRIVTGYTTRSVGPPAAAPSSRPSPSFGSSNRGGGGFSTR